MDLKAVRNIKATPSIKTESLNSSASPDLKSDIIFKTIAERINENIEKAKSINGVFLYNITKDGHIAKKWSKFYTMKRTHFALITNEP